MDILGRRYIQVGVRVDFGLNKLNGSLFNEQTAEGIYTKIKIINRILSEPKQ